MITQQDLTNAILELKTAQQKTDEQIARTDAKLNRLAEMYGEVTEGQKKTDAQLAQTDAQLAKTDAKLNRLAEMYGEVTEGQKKTDAQLAQTDAQLAKTDAKLNRLAEMYGGVGNNQGAVAEEFYFNSLKANPVLGGTRFDFIDKNITRGRGQLEDEFDLLLVNGQEVFIIEVKYKAHTRDLERLLKAKAENFRKLFPEYAHYHQRWGLATFHIHDDLKKAALEQGVMVLQRRGNVIETLAA